MGFGRWRKLARPSWMACCLLEWTSRRLARQLVKMEIWIICVASCILDWTLPRLWRKWWKRLLRRSMVMRQILWGPQIHLRPEMQILPANPKLNLQINWPTTLERKVLEHSQLDNGIWHTLGRAGSCQG